MIDTAKMREKNQSDSYSDEEVLACLSEIDRLRVTTKQKRQKVEAWAVFQVGKKGFWLSHTKTAGTDHFSQPITHVHLVEASSEAELKSLRRLAKALELRDKDHGPADCCCEVHAAFEAHQKLTQRR